MRRRRRTLVTAAAVVLFFALGGSAWAASTGEIVNLLNQQRAANGLPGVGFGPSLADGCDKHNNYMQANGYSDPAHGETPGKPGYTTEGANAPSEVLASAKGNLAWSATSNPWVDAPLHLAIAFDPELALAGGADTHGFQCLRLDSFRSFTGPSLGLFTGPQGRMNVPLSEKVNESPYAPQQLVGIPYGRTTGYQLVAWANGLGASPDAYRVLSAALAGPAGPVDLKVVDSRYSGWFLPTAAVLVPPKPFAPSSTYTGQVTWGGVNGQPFTLPFSFKTAAQPARKLKLGLSDLSTVGRTHFKVTLKAPSALVGHGARVRVYRSDRRGTHTALRKNIRRLRRRQVLRLRTRAGVYRVVVTTQAFTSSGIRYKPSKLQRAFSISVR
jgi:hypothetical protein